MGYWASCKELRLVSSYFKPLTHYHLDQYSKFFYLLKSISINYIKSGCAATVLCTVHFGFMSIFFCPFVEGRTLLSTLYCFVFILSLFYCFIIIWGYHWFIWACHCFIVLFYEQNKFHNILIIIDNIFIIIDMHKCTKAP